MTRPSLEADTANRYPLSFTQEFFCSFDQGDQGGAFGLRFIIVTGWRIAGRLDVAALQGALDDVVERHELLRTVVVRAAEPPYQQVRPPCPVPLELRDLSVVTGRPRDVLAEELIIETEQSPMNPRDVPLLRAVLGRFDDRDHVLVLAEHHSASDGWSMQLTARDLAAFYVARTSGRPAGLPSVRQYREYAAWQRTGADPGADGAPQYWREKLRGGRVFTLPTDRPVPDLHTRPYSVHNFEIGADVMAGASALASELHSSLFMVMLSVFSVLAQQINGTTDPAIRAFSSGRNEPEFQDTMGPFMNLVPFRTDISACTSFRDIVARTRDTCIEAYTNEIPIGHVEAAAPELNLPHSDPRMAQFIMGMFQPQLGGEALPIAAGAREIRKRELAEPEHPDIPSGLVWNFDALPSGELVGGVLFNQEEFDESTVVGWVDDYRRILSRSVREPDRAWKTP